MVFSLGPRHFLLVIYGGISEWLVDKSHREQPIMTETAVVEFGKFINQLVYMCICNMLGKVTQYIDVICKHMLCN